MVSKDVCYAAEALNYMCNNLKSVNINLYRYIKSIDKEENHLKFMEKIQPYLKAHKFSKHLQDNIVPLIDTYHTVLWCKHYRIDDSLCKAIDLAKYSSLKELPDMTFEIYNTEKDALYPIWVKVFSCDTISKGGKKVYSMEVLSVNENNHKIKHCILEAKFCMDNLRKMYIQPLSSICANCKCSNIQDVFFGNYKPLTPGYLQNTMQEGLTLSLCVNNYRMMCDVQKRVGFTAYQLIAAICEVALRQQNRRYKKKEIKSTDVLHISNQITDTSVQKFIPVYRTLLDVKSEDRRKGGKHTQHKSPVSHIRQGHTRVLKSGKVIQVKASRVNANQGDIIIHEVKK